MGITAAVVTVLVALLGITSAGKHLPPAFPRCSLSSPRLNECLRDATQVGVHELVKGVPELGIYSIDPFDVLSADIGAPEGPVALSLNFKDLRISGFHTAKIMNVSYDPKTYFYKMRANLGGPVNLKGMYKVAGKVLLLPINGEGPCSLTIDDVVADIMIHGKETIKNERMYMAAEPLQLVFNTTKLQMNFENLFNGNKELGDNMNRFLNENWVEILHELKPSIEATFGAAFQNVVNRIFLQVPYDNIFLP